MELELVWNGSMRDVYLCVPPPRYLGVVDTSPLPAAAPRVNEDYVLPTSRAQALTTPEIIVRAGATYGVVSQALYRLRQQGRLRWAVLSPRGSGQRPRVYWLGDTTDEVSR